ncbi:MAG: hypothetical protein ACTHLE_27065, partial [Agriterribacter sp.]
MQNRQSNYAQTDHENCPPPRRFHRWFNGEKDWFFRCSYEESSAWAVARSWEAGLIIMGRKSFETMAPYWPTATGPFAAPMNEIPKGVFTQKGFKGIDAGQSPATVSWAEARVF